MIGDTNSHGAIGFQTSIHFRGWSITQFGGNVAHGNILGELNQCLFDDRLAVTHEAGLDHAYVQQFAANLDLGVALAGRTGTASAME